MAESKESRSHPRKEHYIMNLFYLKRGESVRKLISRLPDSIKVLNKENPTRDEDHAYADHNISCTLKIESSVGNGLVTNVCELWEKHARPEEYMSWMQVIPRKRHSYMKPDTLKEESVEIHGGSMISPVIFVKHWHIGASLEFQQGKSLLVIKNTKIRMEINITKDFLYDYVIIDMQNSDTFVYLNVRSSPKLFKDAYSHMFDTESRPVRIPASECGFAKFGYLDCFCLKLKTDSLLTSRILWYTQYKNINVVHAGMRVENPKEEIEPHLKEFEIAYAWKSLCSLGYKVLDHITQEIIQGLYQGRITSQVLFKMFENVSEKPFFHFMEEIYAAMKIADLVGRENGTDVPHNYSKVRRVLLTPTKFVFMPKEPVFQNRIVRQYDEDFFVRLVYRDDNFDKISTMQSNTVENVLMDMKRIFLEGFTIHDRHYKFLGCSNSQLREHSFWFFSSYDGITTDFIRQRAGDLYKERCVATYVSRFGLCFSSSFHTLNIGENEEEIRYEMDVKRNGFCFTDGIGKISTRLASKVAKAMRLKTVPSAFQIRFGGCKGVVAQDPSLGTEKQVLVIRESMKKFESSSTSLEVLQISRPGRLHLNRQVITLLSGLGIPDETFQDLQETMLFDLADMLIHNDKALLSLQELSLATDFKKFEKKVSIVREPFLRSLLLVIFQQRVDDLKRRSRIQIPLDKGRYMMGTSDETQSLAYGQVFIQYSKELHQPLKDVQNVRGKVVVTKNPCFHPGDLRIFEAVYKPELTHMVDCIVFPQLGPRPHPDEMSGSDLDGDEYFVCWDERFHGIKNREPMNFPKAEKKYLKSDVQLTDIVDFLANYIKNDNLGVIANAHLALADSEPEGIFSFSCLELAKKHSDAVDFPKSGKFPQIDTDIRPKSYPDFMMKRDVLPYYSSKVLGKLYRQCQQLHQATKRDNALYVDFYIDDDFVLSLTKKEIEDANLQRNLYNHRLLDIMYLYGLNEESEAISGLIQRIKSGRGCLKDEKFQIGKIVHEKVSILLKKTREIFFEEFGGEEKTYESVEPVIRKASAWYTVAYKNQTSSNRQLLSFPWVVADILSLMKHEQVQINTLEDVEKSLEKRMKRSEGDRKKTLECLQFLRRLVDQNKPPKLHLEWISLSGNGIILPGDRNQYLKVKREDLELIILTLQRLKSPAFPINSDAFDEKLCFPFKLEDGIDGFITIITDDMIVDKSKAINNLLEKYASLKSVVQFLLEEFRECSTINAMADVIEYMLPLLLVREATKGKLEYRGNIIANILFNCLKNIRIYLQNIMTSSNLSESSIHWLEKNMEEIVEKSVVRHIEITLSLSVDTAKREETERFTMSESILVPIESWSAVEYAEPYVKLKLRERTGADIFIYYEDLRKSKALKLEAIGTSLQLGQIHKTLYKMSTNSIAMSIIYAKYGQTTVDEAFSVFFEGCRQDDDLVVFKKYHGPCQKNHEKKHKYLPVLSYSRTDYGKNNFQSAFLTQWRKIRSEYNDIFHGDMCIALVFGAFYVMNIKEDHITVSKLNTYLRNFEERRGSGCGKKDLSYSNSFLPMHGNTEKLEKILETSFTKVNTQRIVKVRIGKKGLFDLDEHLNILQHNAPEIKWFIGQIIHLLSSNDSNADHVGARCKIQSYRNLTKKALIEMEGFEWLPRGNRALIQRNGNGFSVCSNLVTYIREKETATYSNRNLNLEHKVWRTIQLEVSRVKEYDVESLTCRCKKISERTELAIIPYIPDIKSSDDEINRYSKQLWEMAIYFGNIFNGQ